MCGEKTNNLPTHLLTMEVSLIKLSVVTLKVERIKTIKLKTPLRHFKLSLLNITSIYKFLLILHGG